MAIVKYKYTGSQPHNSSIRVKGDDGKSSVIDLRLSPGEEIDLPSDHTVVSDLIAQNLLVPVNNTTSANNSPKK